MRQSQQRQPSEHGQSPKRVTPGEIAPGMGLFIILYVIGADHLVRHEIFQNNEDTWRETVHHVTHGTGEITAPTSGPAVTAIVGTKAVGSGSPQLPR